MIGDEASVLAHAFATLLVQPFGHEGVVQAAHASQDTFVGYLAQQGVLEEVLGSAGKGRRWLSKDHLPGLHVRQRSLDLGLCQPGVRFASRALCLSEVQDRSIPEAAAYDGSLLEQRPLLGC
jgi:hypothetical protein